MPDKDSLFADLILPFALHGCFTYRVPENLAPHIVPGIRVSAPFGSKKILTGMVRRIHNNPPSREVKDILSLLDQLPIVDGSHLEFWDWMSEYYLCHAGEVMAAALPSTLKPSSETQVMLACSGEIEEASLNEYEFRLIERLKAGPIGLSSVAVHIGLSKVAPIIKNLVDKNLIKLEEELQGEYRPKTEKLIRLNPELRAEEQLQELYTKLERRAVKQLEILMVLLQMAGTDAAVPKKELAERSGCSPQVLTAMIGKGILVEETTEISRFSGIKSHKNAGAIAFSGEQKQAIEQIEAGLAEKGVVLLHGITGSGKTEIYINLINRTVYEEGRQVLYLVPEIALTGQLVDRLREYFGDDIAVYHSRHNSQERAEVWKSVRQKSSAPRIVIGARSAIFLPFADLGLIVVDEEHDHSYKQADPAPRYNARDAAVFLGRISRAKVILGSATPAVESYHNALSGKYALVELRSRYGGAVLPTIIIADMQEAYRKKAVKSHFSDVLLGAVSAVLSEGRQVILFQNRRGFALRLECSKCQWMPQCRHCDVTLVYHKGINKLTCHYCGYQQNPIELCPECRTGRMQPRGFGTEKIEDELPKFFPEASIRRMDLDTTKGKQAHAKALAEFGAGKVDILVGTQMVSKGLDFGNIGLVGILNADNMLKFPDFRAAERSYQHLAQVSGRAGRKDKPGNVVIQTFDPDHPIIQQVLGNDYGGMYRDQVLERRNFRYPPFVRLIRLLLLHRDLNTLNRASVELGIRLRRELGEQSVLGPEFPLITRLRNLHQKQILIKLDRGSGIQARKQLIRASVSTIEGDNKHKGLRVIIDVDPY